MRSTFSSLETARRGLESQQVALDVSGHNIANANTKGYTRQISNLQATTPNTVSGNGKTLSVGSGVTVDSINRARDSFVDRQYRYETSKQQYWAEREDTLGKVEGMLNEPSDNSLHSDLDKFWTAWSDLSNNPENMGARSVVRERALTLTDSFQHLDGQVNDMQRDLDANVRVEIDQINDYAQQIKDLNDQIKRSEVAGDNPNDLRDKRDALVDDLAKITNVRVVETKDPNFTDRSVSSYAVLIGDEAAVPAQTLVNDSTVYFLKEPAPPGPDGTPFATVEWANGPNAGTQVQLGSKSGSLQANLEMRDNYLPGFQAQLDELAGGIAEAVNALHQTGQGLTVEPAGIDFFTSSDGQPIGAGNMTLNSVIETDLNRIASGTNPLDGSIAVGDGTVAQKISALSGGWSSLDGTGLTQPVAAASFGDYYGAVVAQLGVDVQQATRMTEGQDVLVTNLYNQRESVSGVSLDEEMTNLVKFQKSYDAAARMVTYFDDMLDTIINRMGVTR